MPLATVTTEVMKALPAALRPNPHSIDEEVMNLVAKGWTPEQLVAYCLRNGDKEPRHVVTSIRGMKDIPLPSDRRVETRKTNGHLKCDQHEGCELCACDTARGVKHHKPVPMPEWFRAALEAGGTQNDFDIALRYRGVDPEHLRHLLDTRSPDYTPTGADTYLEHALTRTPTLEERAS